MTVPLADNITYPALVVSHDAGGANVLLAWAKHNLKWGSLDFLLGGPAKGVFQNSIDENNLLEPEDVNLADYNTVITSTSRKDIDFERKIIKRANELGVYTISMLDHWTNYDNRFEVSGKIYWPNEILVNDIYAKEKVEAINGCPNVSAVNNYYLEEQVKKITELRNNTSPIEQAEKRYLFVSEPSTDKRYTEFDILSVFLAEVVIKQRHEAEPFVVKVRLHPREPVGKFDEIIESYPGCVFVCHETTLFEDIAWADVVVGCQTMAMVIALHAGCQVYSLLPKAVKESALPHAEISRWFES